MKIAIIGSRGIPAHYGGFETFAHELAPRLVTLGHEVTVYCRKGYTGDPPPDSFEGVRLIHAPYLRNRSLETPSHELFSILDSIRRRFDAYYVLGTRSSILYVPLRLTGRKVIVHTDGIEWKRRKWGRAGRAYLKASEWIAARLAAQVLVTDAQAMRRHYLKRYRRDSRCIPYGAPVVSGADLSPLAARGLQEGDYHLVVCRLEPENNVDAIVRGFVASGSPRELVIVGSTNYLTRYHRDLRDLATPKVRFFGAVYGSELQALRVGAFSYIHGHEVGGTNPSLLEAMGCGARVLALDTEFNREALADTGYYWTAADGSLSSLIERVEGSAEEGAKLGARARQRVMDIYTWDRVAAAHDRVLGES